MIAPGGKRLKDHWESSVAHEALNSRAWDFVILQDQSTLGTNYYFEGKTRVGGDEIFRPYAQRWAYEIRKHHATPVFFLTWARRDTPEDQAALNYAYIHTAKTTGSIVAPVGLAWARVRKAYPTVDLYYRDGSHPSPAGSYLAACVIYAAIFRKSPANLPAQISGAPVNLETEQVEPNKSDVLVDLPLSVAARLQAAAGNAWQQLKRHGGYLDVRAPRVPSATLPAGEPLTPANLEGVWRGQISFYPGDGPTEMVLQFNWNGHTWNGHLNVKHILKDFPSESLDLTDLQVGPRLFTFSDVISAGANKYKITFRGVKAARRLLGLAESTVEGKVDGSTYRVELKGDWVLRRDR